MAPAPAEPTAPSAGERELRLVEALRAGDESAFAATVDAYSPAMLRLARVYVSSHAVAEEVVQETWLGVLRGLERFEGRSALKTWIFRILTNTAKTRAVREGRTVPFSALAPADEESAVDPARFLDSSHPTWPGHWSAEPQRWDGIPEDRLLSREVRSIVDGAVEQLPAGQRAVISLRDIEGFPALEVCALLDISEGNQRVLLHRARSRVRRALEEYFSAAAAEGTHGRPPPV